MICGCFITIFIFLPLFLGTLSEGTIEKETTNSSLLTNEIERTENSTEVPRIQTKTHPFVVSLQMIENSKYKHLCGGSILNKQFVLTAAHCTLSPRKLYAKDLTVVAGSDLLFDKTASRFRVRALLKHSKFKPLYGHDIMLLQLESDIPIDDIKFGTIHFENGTRKGGDLHAWLLGWGRTLPNKAKDLEIIPFRTIGDEVCFRDFGFKYLTNTEICAMNSIGPRGACDGDSGGPLIDAEQQVLYGFLSYGRKPCQIGKPYAFTRISTYVSWIQEQMATMLKQNARRKS